MVSDILQFDLSLIKVFTVIKDHNANLLLTPLTPYSLYSLPYHLSFNFL